jgi:thioredoxin reductase/bacterioferritin-associated ferredoxin
VIGGGPGGISAAAVAAEAGLDVILLDERGKLGGQYFKQPADSDSTPPADAQFAAGKALIQRALAAGVEVRSNTSVWGAFGLDAICAVSADDRWRFGCDALILAPGAYERGVPFPGWTLPGVMTTGAAQTLWRSHGVSPGARVLIAGNGPLNMQVAAELTAGGANVVGLAELAPAPMPTRLPALTRLARADPGLIRDGLRYRAVLARARVPVMYGSVISRVDGTERAQVAMVTPIDGSGGLRRDLQRRFEVDAVCLGLGFVPSSEIARSLGCRHEYSSASGQLVTVVDSRGATSVERIWVVGDGALIRGARHAQAQGEIAAFDALRELGRTVSGSLAQRQRHALHAAARHQRFQDALADVYKAPHLTDELAEPETHVCRCEGVTWQAIDRALAAGAGHIGTIKRETRAGMGPCQGRYCGPLITAMVARSTGEQPGELSGFAPSPPVRPVEVGALIGITE